MNIDKKNKLAKMIYQYRYFQFRCFLIKKKSYINTACKLLCYILCFLLPFLK